MSPACIHRTAASATTGRSALTTLLALLITSPLLSAQETQRLELAVHSVSGTYVYFEKGRAAGLRPGDIITLKPPGAGTVRCVVKEVSKNHARALLMDKEVVVALGIPGFVDLPRTRFGQETTGGSGDKGTPATGQGGKIPEHPPWELTLDGSQDGLPLLAPIRSRTPSERSMKIHGRAWFNTDYSISKIGGSNKFLLMDVGTDTTVENPFGSGGEFRFRGDLFTRRSELQFANDRTDSEFRLDRFSYSHGFAADSDLRWQVGRFLPDFVPEFGVVDGGSIDYRVGPGASRLSLVVGGRPDPVTIKAHADDYQASLYYDYDPTPDRSLELGAGYMKSWFRGASNRDLFIFKGFYRPSDDLSFHSSLWVDYYTSSDVIKASGFEVTQYTINGNWSLGLDNGVSIFVDYFRFPELADPAFLPVEPRSLLDDYVFQTSLSSWHRVTDTVRLDFRLVPWKDHEKDGVNLEGRVSLSDLLFEQSALALDFFRTQGSSNDGLGARLSMNGYTIKTNWRLGYEISRYTYDPQPIQSEDSIFQALTGSMDWNLLSATDLVLNIDYRFGDNQDALSFGLYLQTRF